MSSVNQVVFKLLGRKKIQYFSDFDLLMQKRFSAWPVILWNLKAEGQLKPNLADSFLKFFHDDLDIYLTVDTKNHRVFVQREQTSYEVWRLLVKWN